MAVAGHPPDKSSKPKPLRGSAQFRRWSSSVNPRRSHLREALATVRGALLHFMAWSSVFWILGVIALGRLLKNGPWQPFLIGSVPIPKWQGAGFTNFDVIFLCAAAILALVVAFALRYIQHRKKLSMLRSKGITDFDEDGKRDTFTDRFLDEL